MKRVIRDCEICIILFVAKLVATASGTLGDVIKLGREYS